MREWSNIEKQMKTVVNAHEAPAPDFIWNAIEEELHNSRTKPKYWMFAVAAFLLLSLAGYLLTQNIDTDVNIPLKQNTEIRSNLETETASAFSNVEKQHTSSVEAEKGISSSEVNTSIVQTKTNNATESKNVSAIAVEHDSGRAEEKLAISQVVEQSLNQESIYKEQVNHSSTFPALHVQTVMPAKAKNTMLGELAPIATLTHVLETERDIPEYTDGIECPSFSNSFSIHPFVELNGLFGMHSKSLDPILSDEIDVEAFKSAREETESAWYNWGGQVHVGLNVNRNFYFGTGLEWSQAKDKFKYEDEGVTKIVIDLDPEGNPIDTSIVNGMFVSTGEVRYNMLDIPVFIGASRSMGSWDLGVEGALLFNLSFSANGKLLGEDFEITRAEQANIYRDKLGFGFRGSVVLRKFLSDGYSFHIKPSLRTSLEHINEENYLLDTRLNMLRLEMGFRRDF